MRDIVNKLGNTKKELLFKVINYFLSGFVFFSLMPLWLVVLFMWEEGFFSYEFLLEGTMGLNIFIFFSFLLTLSYFLFVGSGFFIFYSEWRSFNKSDDFEGNFSDFLWKNEKGIGGIIIFLLVVNILCISFFFLKLEIKNFPLCIGLWFFSYSTL